MAASKPLSRTQKRYVPQQESYKNLPGLRPVAEPTGAAARPSEVDAGAMRLREMSQALAAGSKALTDYFAMEKSAEETNRVANRALALAGLPQERGPGPGLLDWGSDYGYQEGLGLAEGSKLAASLELELERNNHFVDPENPDPESTLQQVQLMVDRAAKDSIGDRMGNSAFVQGLSKPLAEMKVLHTATAMQKLEAAKFRKELQSVGQIAIGRFMPILGEAQGNPKKVRESMTSFLREFSHLNIHKDALAEVALLSVHSELNNQYNDLYNMDPSESIPLLTQLAAQAHTLVQAAGMPDESGILLGGTTIDSKGKRVSPLSQTIKEIHESKVRMVRDLDTLKSNQQSRAKASGKAEIFRRLYDGDDPDAVYVWANEVFGDDPETLSEIMPYIFETHRKDYAYKYSETVSLLQRGVSPEMARRMAANGELSKTALLDFMAVYNQRERERMDNEQRISMARSNRLSEERQRETEIEIENNRLVSQYLNENITDNALWAIEEDIRKALKRDYPGQEATPHLLEEISKGLYTRARLSEQERNEKTRREEAHTQRTRDWAEADRQQKKAKQEAELVAARLNARGLPGDSTVKTLLSSGLPEDIDQVEEYLREAGLSKFELDRNMAEGNKLLLKYGRETMPPVIEHFVATGQMDVVEDYLAAKSDEARAAILEEERQKARVAQVKSQLDLLATTEDLSMLSSPTYQKSVLNYMDDKGLDEIPMGLMGSIRRAAGQYKSDLQKIDATKEGDTAEEYTRKKSVARNHALLMLPFLSDADREILLEGSNLR